jgi:hypothetical protein
MKRLSWAFCALVILVAPLTAGAQSVTVLVNGETMNFTQPPIVRAGRVFVPLRGVFERLGASVVYASGEINATRHGRTISLTIGSTQATVDGQPAMVDVAPFVVADTTFVPLRFISQALGASVNWNDSTSTVTINGPAAPPPMPPPQPPYPRVHFVDVSPTGTIYNPMPTLRFSFDRPIQIADIRVSIDGQSVTDSLRRNGQNFAVDLPFRLIRGPHRVRVVGSTPSGGPFDLSWTFVRE